MEGTEVGDYSERCNGVVFPVVGVDIGGDKLGAVVEDIATN